jgi:hypothetical protein
MSPGNQGVFQLLKEVTFRRILVFSTCEKGANLGVIPVQPIHYDLLVELFQKLLTIWHSHDKYMLCHNDCKNHA